MRLSDARLRQRQTKLIYPDHRLLPRFTEDAARDRSYCLLERAAALPNMRSCQYICGARNQDVFSAVSN
jgi:hypothetical protein